MNPQEPPFNSNLPADQPASAPSQSPNAYQNDSRQRVSNDLTVTQPGEVTVCEIKRHQIGILIIYIGMGIMLTAAAILLFAVLPRVITDNNSVTSLGAVVFLILAAISLVYALIATTVYWGNKWVVTSDSVTQINRTSLFGRQSAQLALSNIEDVTAEQNGILSHMFNYGVLKAETAGHRSKFVFLYAPNPNYYAQQILKAREELGQSGHHG